MFRIDTPAAEDRSEPLLEFGQAVLAAPRLRSPPAGLVALDMPAEGHREPALPAAPPLLPGSPMLPERGPPVESRQRGWPFGSIGSLVLHLLPLLLLLDWPMQPPAEITPIPVQLVVEPPPPPPKPAPKPIAKPAPKPPPPRGRIASEDLGDTQAKGQDQDKSEAPAAHKQPAAVQESPAEAPQKTAAVTPPPPAPAPAEIAPAKPPEPRELPVPKPSPKPAQAAHQPLRRVPERGHLQPRPARFPGPAATRDEYLAYLAALTREHLNLLPQGVVGSRRGETVIEVLVLDDGTIATLRVGRSSGYPDIDSRVEQMIRAVGRFPPLPQWFQGPSMQLQFRLQFPVGLDN